MKLVFVFFLLFSLPLLTCFLYTLLVGVGTTLVMLTLLLILALLLVFSGASAFLVFLLGSSILVGSLMFFVSLNFLLLFVLMEVVMFTIFLFLLFFGYQVEKVTSTWYLIMFSVSSGMLFLGTILSIKPAFMNVEESLSGSVYLLLVLGFLVKLPFFTTHLWLPKVHVESSTMGSVLLASVLLKLGCWGFMVIHLLNYSLLISLIFLSLMCSALLSVFCLYQSDGKSLIAYSSVVHMATFFYFLMNQGFWGLEASLIIIISHGVVSGLLFLYSGLFYNSSGSREMLRHQGLFLSSFWFCVLLLFFLLSNSGLAPTLSFFSEVYGLMFIFKNNILWVLPLVVYFMFSFMYSLFYALLGYLGKKETPVFMGALISLFYVNILVLSLFIVV